MPKREAERATERPMRRAEPRECRSLIGGALGDQHFEPGDLIRVPAGKYDEWLAAGLIAPDGGDR